MENVPDIPEEISDRMQMYLNTRSASFKGWNPDGEGMFIVTRFGETSQVHSLEMPGGARKQLTFFDEPVSSVAVRPSVDNPGFLFTKDVGGNETYQIFYFDAQNGSYEMHSDGIHRYGSLEWSEDGGKYAFYSNARNGVDFDIYVTEMKAPREPELVYQGIGYNSPIEFSPDGDMLLISNYISITERNIYILDLDNGEIEPLMVADNEIAVSSAAWGRDGKGVYFTSDLNSEFQILRYYNFRKKMSNVLVDNIPWNVESIELSPDGKLMTFTINENGASRIYLMNLKSEKLTSPSTIPTGIIYSLKFNPQGDKLAFNLITSQTPGDVYTLNIMDNSITRWTYSEVGGLNTSDFIIPEMIEYPTFDKVDGKRRTVPAYYYRPEGEGPFPVVIMFHGGPESQFRPYFFDNYQFWVKELGIAVIAPNVRGSSGYGKSYLKLDNDYLRENTVRDGGALLDWIDDQPLLDNNRIGVYGGSYGGYMVLAMMTHYNDRIAACVDIVGISNFVSFLENTSEYRRDARRVEYGDERDPELREYLIKISPTTNADKITRPIFIIQGLNDPRVPASESEQMVEVIRENGGNVWYLLYTDEGHGFRKKKNRDFYQNAVVMFFKKFLLKQ